LEGDKLIYLLGGLGGLTTKLLLFWFKFAYWS